MHIVYNKEIKKHKKKTNKQKKTPKKKKNSYQTISQKHNNRKKPPCRLLFSIKGKLCGKLFLLNSPSLLSLAFRLLKPAGSEQFETRYPYKGRESDRKRFGPRFGTRI